MTLKASDLIEPTLETVHEGDRIGPIAFDLGADAYPPHFDADAVDRSWLLLPDGSTALPHSVGFEFSNLTFSSRYLRGHKLNARIRHVCQRPLVPPVTVTGVVEIARTFIRRGREHVEFNAVFEDDEGRVVMTSQADWVMNSPVRHDHDSPGDGSVSVFDRPLPEREFSIPVPPHVHELRAGAGLPSLERQAWLYEPPGGHGPDSIHSDEYARRVLGTRGAVMVGSTVLGYVNEVLGRALGPTWLERGSLDVRFIRPMVHNDLVTAHARVDEVVHDDRGDWIEFEVWVTNAEEDGGTSIVGTARYEL